MGDGAECKMQNAKCKMKNEKRKMRSPRFARDEGLLRYVAGFFMRWEYKETERGCRSRGAPGARDS